MWPQKYAIKVATVYVAILRNHKYMQQLLRQLDILFHHAEKKTPDSKIYSSVPCSLPPRSDKFSLSFVTATRIHRSETYKSITHVLPLWMLLQVYRLELLPPVTKSSREFSRNGEYKTNLRVREADYDRTKDRKLLILSFHLQVLIFLSFSLNRLLPPNIQKSSLCLPLAKTAVTSTYASLHARVESFPPLINTTGNEVNFIHMHSILNSCGVAVTNTAHE